MTLCTARTAILATCTLLAANPLTAAPAHAQMSAEDRFTQLDSNQDGVVTYNEMEARVMEKLQQTFARSDANQDGVLSLEEMQQARISRQQRLRSRMIENLPARRGE